jgi:O-antigen ligase
VSPWWVLAGLAVVPLAALAPVPEPATAALLGLGLVALVVRHPGNGLVALVLGSALALGEPKTPYFVGVHVAALIVLAGAVAHAVRTGCAPIGRRLGWTLAFLVGAAVVSLPLDLANLRADLWLGRSLDWPYFLVHGIPDAAPLKYLDRVLLVTLAAGLALVAAQPAMRGLLAATLAPLVALVAALAAFGLLRFFGVFRLGGQYLTLSFWTWQQPELRLTAVAWNPDYLALYLVLVLPLGLVLAGSAATPRARAGAGLAVGLGGLALLLTFQRAGWAAGLVALGALAALQARAAGAGGRRRALALAGAAVGLLLLGAVLDQAGLEGRILARVTRFADDPTRLKLWAVARNMWTAEPWLGIGTGRYAARFLDYGGAAYTKYFGPFWGTAHSLYLHVLAEQGVVGLASVLALFGGIWLAVARGLRALAPAERPLAVGLLASLAGWLAYGFVQYTFRIEALVYLVFVLAGLAAGLLPAVPAVPGAGARRGLVVSGLAILALAVVAVPRAQAALRSGISPGYEGGFYRWERQPDNSPARWTRARAALAVRRAGTVVRLPIRAAMPGVETRPQRVRIWVGSEPVREHRLDTAAWQVLELPAPGLAGAPVLVSIEVDPTFVPAALTATRDTRRLGVMVGPVTWR